MPLTEAQVNRVWEKMVEAEIRSLYFADLASRYSRRRQIITGIALFLSSTAAATMAAKTDPIVPIASSVITAVATAYAIAIGLDRKILTMVKLQSQWSAIASDLESLWNHWFDADAEDRLGDVLRRSRDASELGSTEAPYIPKIERKWTDHVFLMRGLASA